MKRWLVGAWCIALVGCAHEPEVATPLFRFDETNQTFEASIPVPRETTTLVPGGPEATFIDEQLSKHNACSNGYDVTAASQIDLICMDNCPSAVPENHIELYVRGVCKAQGGANE